MNALHKMRLSAAIIITVGNCGIPANAQEVNRTVEQYQCKDVMRENGSARDVAIAFLHGYLLGKAATSAFNLESFQKQTDTFIDRCLSNPNEKAVDAMVVAKK